MRDDTSDAQLNAPTTECCELLADLRTILHEVHIVRNGVPVWEGPITRIEYDFDEVRIYAEDVLWQAKRRVIEQGYDMAYPNIGNVISRMDWLLRDQCFARDGDPWNVVPHLHPVYGPDDPSSSRAVFAWQMYVWEDFDKYAEDMGADYTVVNRDIYYFDTQLAWKILPPLDQTYLSQFPRIVEYGNQAGTRGVVTNGKGFAGVWAGPPPWSDPDQYGTIDWLISNTSDGQLNRDPTPEDIASWADTARRNTQGRYPPPVSVVIPANTTLLPGGPWLMEDLIPGAWFEVTVDRLCRNVTEWQRIQEVVVTEKAPEGETVQFSSASAPSHMVVP